MNVSLMGFSPLLRSKSVSIEVAAAAGEDAPTTKEALKIEGFMSLADPDRSLESVDPVAFNLEQFRLNKQLWIDHEKWLRSDGNTVPVGVVDTIDPVVVERGDGGMLNVVSLDTKEAITSISSEDFLVKEGDRGIWVSANILEEEVAEMVMDGRYRSFSWRGIASQNERTRELTNVDLMEVSIVSIPAHPHASFTIAKSLSPVNSKDPFTSSQFTITDSGIVHELSTAKGMEKGAIGPHSTGTSDKPWDSGTNKKNLKEDQTSSYYRRMFTWVDSGNDAKVKASYKFPHHEVSSDGSIGAANLSACSAIIANLNGARTPAGIPTDDRAGVYRHAASHLRSAGKEPTRLKNVDSIPETPWSECPFIICAVSSNGTVETSASKSLEEARTIAVNLLSVDSVCKTVIMTNTHTAVDGSAVFESVDMFTTTMCKGEDTKDLVELSAAEACALGFGVKDAPNDGKEAGAINAPTIEGGDISMTVEELKAAMEEVMKSSLDPVVKRIEALEKGADDPGETEEPVADPDVGESAEAPVSAEVAPEPDESEAPTDAESPTVDTDALKELTGVLTEQVKTSFATLASRLDTLERKPAAKSAIGDDEVKPVPDNVVKITAKDYKEAAKDALLVSMVPQEVRDRRNS